MRKILGIASLIMSTGVVHAEQLNEQEQISPYSANVILQVNIFHVVSNKLGVSLHYKLVSTMQIRMGYLWVLGHPM